MSEIAKVAETEANLRVPSLEEREAAQAMEAAIRVIGVAGEAAEEAMPKDGRSLSLLELRRMAERAYRRAKEEMPETQNEQSVPTTGGGLELPWTVAAALPVGVAMVNSRTTPKARGRMGCLVAGGIGFLALCGIGTVGLAALFKPDILGQGIRIGKTAGEPDDKQLKELAQLLAEKQDVVELYDTGAINPGYMSIGDAQVQQLYAKLGPTWMFSAKNPDNVERLRTYFGREFSAQEIEAFRNDPTQLSEFYRMLDQMVQEGRITPEERAFYNKTPAQVEAEYNKRFGLPTPLPTMVPRAASEPTLVPVPKTTSVPEE